MGWNRAKIAVWGRKQEAARHCRVAPSRSYVNRQFAQIFIALEGGGLCKTPNFIFGTLHK